jgi:hypothetical protein
MTDFKQAPNNGKRGSNIKDGHHPGRHQTQIAEVEWLAAGFSRKWIRGAPRLTYTWKGDFPIFEVTPGTITDDQGKIHEGLIAKYALAEKEILFPYGTDPKVIASRLNDEIEAIMYHDATIDDLPLNWKPASNENIDLWMVQPESAKRQSTPAVQKFAQKNKVLLEVADEMMLERSQ